MSHSMQLSVVIPTHRRGSLLRSALASVRNQSRQDLISEVIVSENSDDQGSAAVVKEFPELPIRHVTQNPPVDPGTHFCRLLEYARTEWVACLGDDDMYGRYHLEEAARLLARHTDAVAYVAQDAIVANDSRVITAGHHSGLILAHDPTKRNSFTDSWIVDHAGMAVACLAITPLNMWGVVSRRDVLKNAFTAFAEADAGHDSDRYMLWLLARQGPVIIGREIGLFYRRHGDNACARFLRDNYDEQQRKAAEYTRRMLADAEENRVHLEEMWLAALGQMPESARAAYWSQGIPGAKRAIREAWGPAVAAMFPGMDSPLKRIVRDWVPPAVYRRASRLYRSWLQAAKSKSQ